MKNRKIFALFLAVLTLVSVLSVTVAARGYSVISNKGVALEFPTGYDFLSSAKKATVKAARANGSIYYMPAPESGNGNLGNVRNGETVYLVAKRNGYYFFVTEEGLMGWNGAKNFKVKESADYIDVLEIADSPVCRELYDEGEVFLPDYCDFMNCLESFAYD